MYIERIMKIKLCERWLNYTLSDVTITFVDIVCEKSKLRESEIVVCKVCGIFICYYIKFLILKLNIIHNLYTIIIC